MIRRRNRASRGPRGGHPLPGRATGGRPHIWASLAMADLLDKEKCEKYSAASQVSHQTSASNHASMTLELIASASGYWLTERGTRGRALICARVHKIGPLEASFPPQMGPFPCSRLVGLGARPSPRALNVCNTHALPPGWAPETRPASPSFPPTWALFRLFGTTSVLPPAPRALPAPGARRGAKCL